MAMGWDPPPQNPPPFPQPLQPIVHIWDSSTLLTLQQIGLGTFERGVGSLAFSSAVSPPWGGGLRVPDLP